MISGMLNPDKIWHQKLVHLPTSPYTVATLPWEIKKSFFNSILHTYFRLFTLSQKKTNCYSITHPPQKCHRITLYNAQILNLFHFFHAYRVPICENRRVAEASCCDMGRISAQRGKRCSWSVAKKDWKHVSVQKVVTLNICCNVASLTFHLPHIQQRLEECSIGLPSVRWKRWCILRLTFFRCGG